MILDREWQLLNKEIKLNVDRRQAFCNSLIQETSKFSSIMKSKYLIYFILIVFFTSCIDSKRTSYQLSSSGDLGDVLVVMNIKLWEGSSGEVIRNTLASFYEGLPQEEPMYDLMQINPAGFVKAYKTQRNILVVKIGVDQPESKILVHKNLWARPQIIITIVAPSESDFKELFNSNSDKILALLTDMGRQSLIKTYKSIRDENIVNKLVEKYSVSLYVPKGYKMDVEEKDFVWLSHEYRDIIQGIFIYFYDYTDAETFTRDYLVERRNKFLKKYVPGEIEGSYMSTEALYPPIFREYKLNDNTYTAEIRGLWRMENGLAMGGPFISISQLDEARNRVITVEGFVFAPAHKKRDLLRQVEAIALSLEIKK
jgi:hypothetical protein